MRNRLFAAGAALVRCLSWRPSSYRQVLPWTAVSFAAPVLITFSVFGFLNDWSRPWPELVLVWTPAGLVLYGTAGSAGVWRRLQYPHAED
jgi:hypothetical protein